MPRNFINRTILNLLNLLSQIGFLALVIIHILSILQGQELLPLSLTESVVLLTNLVFYHLFASGVVLLPAAGFVAIKLIAGPENLEMQWLLAFAVNIIAIHCLLRSKKPSGSWFIGILLVLATGLLVATLKTESLTVFPDPKVLVFAVILSSFLALLQNRFIWTFLASMLVLGSVLAGPQALMPFLQCILFLWAIANLSQCRERRTREY